LSAVERVLTLLGRPECHLCHEMRAVVEPLLGELQARLVETDIGGRGELERRYRLDIPVLLAGEVEVARHRIDAASLRERLEALWGTGPPRTRQVP
jgi:hypothetical protein